MQTIGFAREEIVISSRGKRYTATVRWATALRRYL